MAFTLAIILSLVSGIGYRILTYQHKLIAATPIMLPVPLSAFPTEIGQWVGKDVPIPENIQRVARNDDFLNRIYINKQTNEWANVYIAYTARPRTMLGHRPQVCYVGGGWVHDDTQPMEITSNSIKKIPCLLHRFHMPQPLSEETVVLNYYIVNGQVTTDESVFSGVGWRTPNIAGDPARYVAQVQISSVLENSVLTAATDMSDLLLDYFPGRNGEVRAAEFRNTRADTIK